MANVGRKVRKSYPFVKSFLRPLLGPAADLPMAVWAYGTMTIAIMAVIGVMASFVPVANAACPYDYDCLNNPFGAGSPFKPDGLMNPFSEYGSPYSNESWRNPYATNPPIIVDQQGRYRGRLSVNPHLPDSITNPYGQYGNPYSPDSLLNPYGAGNPFSTDELYVIPAD